MKQTTLVALSILSTIGASGAQYNENFCDSTLRIDYMFGGGPNGVSVMIDRQSKSAGWAGRRERLAERPYAGNGVISVVDPKTNEIIYTNPFSSLFLEWLHTPEANKVQKGFENSFIVPLPRKEAEIRLTLYDNRQEVLAETSHLYSPEDELVALRGSNPLPHQYIHRGGDTEKAIDVAILAEGYKTEEMDSFINHAQTIANEILSYEPFASNKDRFNFVAVMSPSNESGVSVPLRNQWTDTAFGSHYSTFYSSRYLTTSSIKKVYDALDGIPFEHIIILVNTDEYGGGGIYNCYQIAAARNKLTMPVAVHEFGHSFGGLADEYFYTNEEDETYPLDIEPWEPNITTLVDFESKWSDMVDPNISIPTPWEEDNGTREEKMKRQSETNYDDSSLSIGAYEGGGYKAKGVYRPTITCRMRDNYYPSFCPVCEKALLHIINFYTPSE